MNVVASIASGLLSLVACAGGFSALGMLAVFVMEPRIGCNPYAVFPCRCDGRD